jgi:hypothetical protein
VRFCYLCLRKPKRVGVVATPIAIPTLTGFIAVGTMVTGMPVAGTRVLGVITARLPSLLRISLRVEWLR